MSKVRKFIVNLQNKPEETKKIITWVIVSIIGLGLIIFWVLNIINIVKRV